jgi:hypothetical protein
MANRKVRYIGPIDEVALEYEGVRYTVERNHQAELPEDLAKNLVRAANWEYVKEERKSESAAKDEPKAAKE